MIRHLARLRQENVATVARDISILVAHRHPEVRSAALSALFVTGRHRELRELAVKALRLDTDESVRATAAFAIAATSSGESQGFDVRILLPILRNPEESLEVRRAVYEALQIIFRRTDFPDATEDFNPERDVDWLWIAQVEVQ